MNIQDKINQTVAKLSEINAILNKKSQEWTQEEIEIYKNREFISVERDLAEVSIQLLTLEFFLKKPYKEWTAAEKQEHGTIAQLRRKEEQLGQKKIELLKHQTIMLRMKSSMAREETLFFPCETNFYKNIFNAEENDSWLSFRVEIPCTISLKYIFIRESYKCIASNIMKETNKKIFITGSPGIGKSLFLMYLLWKLVKARKRVLLIYHPDIIYYDGEGGVFELKSIPSVVDHKFWESDFGLWCLMDDMHKREQHLSEIPYQKCTFVLATSPKREMVNEFQKPPPPLVFYMPIWTETELETIAPFFSVTLTDWRKRYRLLGGIPRNVLEVTTDDPRYLLVHSCAHCKLDDCLKVVTGLNSYITENVNVAHSLIHMTSVDPYIDPSVSFASQTALDIIMKMRGKEAKLKMQELLETCHEETTTAALCGYIFERYAI